jgi:hypothetical protein
VFVTTELPQCRPPAPEHAACVSGIEG